jgi:hypothetical protein
LDFVLASILRFIFETVLGLKEFNGLRFKTQQAGAVMLSQIYKPQLASLTDLYQLTMAYGYFKSGGLDKESVFHLYFRNNPFHGGYGVACGLASMIDLVQNFCFAPEDLTF